MPRPSRPWFRFYVEALYDRKLRRRDPATRWLFVVCLGAARQSPQPGRLLLAEGDALELADLVDMAAMPKRQVESGMADLEAAGIVVFSDGCWFVPHWDDRQFESDDVTARTQRHRHVVGTTLERSNDVPENDVGTHQITETDTETETTTSRAPHANGATRASPNPDGFDGFWSAYPRKVGKGAALKAWKAAAKKAEPCVLIERTVHFAELREGQDPKFTPYPATWLNREQWLDVPDPPALSAMVEGYGDFARSEP